MLCWPKIICIVTSLSTITGPAVVIDGDTIRINNQSVRLKGVDAPELYERGGLAARMGLAEIIGNRDVTCTLSEKSYKRRIGVCMAGTTDVGSALIRAGLALDCAAFSGGKYRGYEPEGARTRIMQKPYC